MTTSALSPAQSATVRDEVADVLARSAAFQALPPAERADILRNTARVAEAMTAAALGGAPQPQQQQPQQHKHRRRPAPPIDDPYAAGLADPAPVGNSTASPIVTTTTTPAGTATTDPDRWRADERFRAEGVAQGVTQVGRMIKEVDFPGFVASLVKGTFNAVVDASIQQMKAYGDLVQSVAMSVNEFRDQNVSPAQGRSHLVSKYPQMFQLGTDSKGLESVLMKDDFDLDNLPDFQKELGLAQPVDEVDDGVIELLTQASRDDLARSRQQLLATTILMGINRIIITDGRVNAKLVFTFSAEDTMSRQGTAEDYEIERQRKEFEIKQGNQFAKGVFEKPVPIKVSSTTGESSAGLEAAGKITGEVSLNFRSETFPLEQMANTDQMFRIREARGGGAPAPPAAAPATPAAPTR
jgi:hypothetical protein